MKKYLKLFCSILVVAVMAICFAACGNDDGKTGTPTDVSGKTYIYVSASESTGMVPKDELETAFGGAFKFETDGTITGVNVEDGSQSFHFLSGSKWTQSGANVSVKTGEGTEAITYSGTATGETLSLSATNYGMTVKLNYKLYKAAGEEGGDGEDPIVVTDKVEGTYKFYSYKIASVNQTYYVGDKIPGEDFTLTEDFYVVILKADNTGVMAAMGSSIDVTWSKTGDELSMSIEGMPYSGTLKNRTAVITDDDGNVWTFNKFSDSTALPSITPDIEKDISGSAFSFDDVVKKSGTITTSELAAIKTRLADSHFVFEEGGKFIAVMGNQAIEGTWKQTGNKVTATIEGDPQEFTISGTKITAIVSSDTADENYTLEMRYEYDANYKYDEGGSGSGSGGGSTVVPPENLEGCAYTFYDLEVVKNPTSIEITPSDINAIKESLGDTHFVFEKGGVLISVYGTEVTQGTWEQSGDTIKYSMAGDSGVFTVRGDKIYTEMGDSSFMFGLTYAYDPAYKVPAGGNEGGEVNPGVDPSLNFGGTYAFGGIGSDDGGQDASFNEVIKKYSSYYFDFNAESSDGGVCTLITADGTSNFNYKMSGNIVSINGTLYDGNPFNATMTFDGTQLTWEVVEGNSNYIITLIKK